MYACRCENEYDGPILKEMYFLSYEESKLDNLLSLVDGACAVLSCAYG